MYIFHLDYCKKQMNFKTTSEYYGYFEILIYFTSKNDFQVHSVLVPNRYYKSL